MKNKSLKSGCAFEQTEQNGNYFCIQSHWFIPSNEHFEYVLRAIYLVLFIIMVFFYALVD